MTPPRPLAVLFDLDGTLADTAPDLAAALNRTLVHFDRPPAPYEHIRPVVSHGAMALVRTGFAMTPEDPGFAERRQFLLDSYAKHLCDKTTLFDGMAEVLAYLEGNGIHWGIVTNKPAWLTEPLIDAMGLDDRAACVISGDTCSNRKPHPEPILHACQLIGCDVSATWYVGDAGRDIQAGRAAGCTTVAAMYGYLHPDDPADTWNADLTITQPRMLLDLLGQSA
jgi:phosphoglycolate phosphatase